MKKQIWKTQSEVLQREIKKNKLSDALIAKKMGVSRQQVFYWRKGETAIPEEKLVKLCDILDCTPQEVRYDILPCDYEDLIFVVKSVEKELVARDIKIDAQRKAEVVSFVFGEFEAMKRRQNESIAKSALMQSLNDALSQ